MKQRTLQWNVVKDDGGQAMTEFVIVIPIILLFFFAMLQYFANVQASQLANYAAFVSARVYAVRASIDANDANDKAQMAAAMVLAPIASPVPGELSLGGNVPGLGSVLNGLMGNEATKYATGFAMAQYVRFGILGGSVSNTVEGSPQQVDTIINYPQPIFVPGLASMWNFVTGDKIYTSMQPLATGLTGGVQSYNRFMGTWEQIQQQVAAFGIKLPNMPAIFLPYVNIQSKCTIGYENWGSNAQLDRPRLKDTVADDGSSSDTQSQINSAQQKAQQQEQDGKNYQNAANNANQACNNLCTADSNLASAHQRDDPIIQNQGNPPPYTAAQVAAAKQDLHGYVQAQSDAEKANTTAQSNLNSAASAMQSDTGQSIQSSPCGCN